MPSILRTRVDAITYSSGTELILDWSRSMQSRYVCVANTHMLMEAHDSDTFREMINAADLVTPDGMPLVWVLCMKGYLLHDRVYGPILMTRLLECAARECIPVGFYGSTAAVLALLVKRAAFEFPDLKIDYAFSPPFRDLSPEEDMEVCRQINTSGARILFVGLGCPKQECWMAAHRGQIPVVMIGVGAAFDFLAGVKKQAPSWMQAVGLEWLFRLIQEPQRLWKRYLYHNPRFAVLAVAELLGLRSA